MRLKVYKDTDKNLQDIYEDEREVKEVELKIGNTLLVITEQQYGQKLDETYVDIANDKATYSMSFKNFIENAVS